MDKIYRICIFIDTTLENNTILVPTKMYDELKNDDFVVAKYPVISLSSLIKLSDVNLIKIDTFDFNFEILFKQIMELILLKASE